MLQRIKPKQRVLFLIVSAVVLGVGIFVFYKIKKRSRPLSAPPLSDNFQKKQFESRRLIFSELNDLENNKDRTTSSDKAASGTKSCKLSVSNEFGFAYSKELNKIPDYPQISEIKVEVKCWVHGDIAAAQYMLAIENAEGKNIFQASKPIVCEKTYDWNSLQFIYSIDKEFLNSDNKIKIYAWNKSLREFYLDDISVSFFGEREMRNNQTIQSNFLFDFETEDSIFLSQKNYIKSGVAHSGKMIFDLNNAEEYGPIVTKQFGDVGLEPAKRVNMSIWVYPMSDNASVELAVSLFGENDKSFFWQGKNVEGKFLPKEKWTKINVSINLPTEGTTLNDAIQVIARNKGKTKLLFDDFEIVYDDLKTPHGNASQIDPNVFYENRFVGERNKAPFKTIYLYKQEINNGNGLSITAPDKQSNVANFSPSDEFLVGDFAPDKNGLDEIICVKKISQGLFSYNQEEKQFKKLWDNSNAADSLWNNSNSFYCGDFNSDGKCDVLLVNKKNKDWGMIDFDGKNWKVISQGKNPKTEWITKDISCRTELEQSGDVIFSGNYLDEKPTLLKLNTNWRFDLKLIGKDAIGDLILGNVDFKGYTNDYNPKYYEMIKIVSGKFLTKNKHSLLVVVCNCADKNFKGKTCKEYENLNNLPNTTAIYQFE